MTWQKLSFQISSMHLIELISDLLDEAGAIAVTLESAQNEEIFEPSPGANPLWEHSKIIGLFHDDVDLEHVIHAISATIAPQTIHRYTIETILDQDWQKICTDAFQPICFKEKLWVCPSWHALPNDGKPYLILDPGLAFGTGAHPTTALCLEWLAENLKKEDLMIDYGCGSGILAIAALKLGAQTVWAIDNDPQSLEATLKNSQSNHLSSQQLHILTPEELPPIQADTLIANILANPLIQLAPHLRRLVKTNGRIVLSGILSHQTDIVMSAYAPWCEFSSPVMKEEWALLEGRIL